MVESFVDGVRQSPRIISAINNDRWTFGLTGGSPENTGPLLRRLLMAWNPSHLNNTATMHSIPRAVIAVVLLSLCASGVPYVQRFFQTPETVHPFTLKAFSWNNCGPSDDIFRALNFSVTPDPIVIPGSLQISFAMQFTEDFGSPLKASVLIAKKLGSNYIKIPCLGQFGTCDYDDFCQILDMIPECPDPLQQRNISCQCPFSQGSYSLPPTTVQLEYLPLVAGDYHARINMSTVIGTASRHVGCYEIYLTLSEQYSMFHRK